MVHNSRVPLIVLAHLGLVPLAACKPESGVRPDDATQQAVSASAAPTTAAAETVSSTATAPATTTTPVTTTTATATATATATTPTASASATAPSQGTVCKSDSDCPPYAFCRKVDATASTGHCDYRPHYNLGRPLVVEGDAYVAPCSHGVLSSNEQAALVAAATEEHASIAAFARTIAELMALGAPTWLLLETQSALGDEIRHTEMTLAMVERCTGHRPLLGPLEAATLPMRRGESAAAELFRDVFRGGAIGETLAAAEAERRCGEATDPEVRAFYDTIFVDEARHAALAFKTLQWLLAARPELAVVRDEEKSRLLDAGSFEARTLVSPLLHTLV